MGVKFVVSEPATKRSVQIDVEKDKIVSLFGKKISDEFNGDLIGLNGYSLKITGGSDKDGFPMNPSVETVGRRRVLLKGPPGFHPKIKGERKRRTVRGNTLSEDIQQINVKVLKVGEKTLEAMFPSKKEEPKPKEKPVETPEKKEEKVEIKPEKKEPEKKEEAKIEKKEEKPAETKPAKEEKKPEQKPVEVSKKEEAKPGSKEEKSTEKVESKPEEKDSKKVETKPE